MAAVIVQIQGIKDVSENHTMNGVKLSFFQLCIFKNIENQIQSIVYIVYVLCIFFKN